MSLLDGPIVSSYETLTLERLEFGLQQHIGAHALHSMVLERVEAVLTDGFIYRLKVDVLAEKLPPEKVERSTEFFWAFPASVWQHFKLTHLESWWLGWLVRRRPVKYTEHTKTATLTVDLERYRTFPQCNYVFPKDLGPYVKIATLDTNWSLR